MSKKLNVQLKLTKKDYFTNQIIQHYVIIKNEL